MMGIFYLFIRMVIWMHHLSRLIEMYLKTCILCQLCHIQEVRKVCIKVVWQTGKCQTFNDLISGCKSTKLLRFCPGADGDTLEYLKLSCALVNHTFQEVAPWKDGDTYWALSKVHKRDGENFREGVAMWAVKGKVFGWGWMDLVIHRVFKMEAKEEFGWLLSFVLGSVGRC